MKVSLDLHDFSVVNNRMDLLFRLKERYPNFKVSLFTIPVDDRRDWGPYLLRPDYLRLVKENLGWMQLIPHGYAHNGWEMRNCDYREFLRFLPEIEKAFKGDGLPYEKGFCAPHWKWSDGVVKALDELGWWGAVDPRQPHMQSTRRFFRYSHDIAERIPAEGDVVKLHGHLWGTKNDLGKCIGNLFNVPLDAEWHFVTDFLEEM